MPTVTLAGTTWEVLSCFANTTVLQATARVWKNGGSPQDISTGVEHIDGQVGSAFWSTTTNDTLAGLYAEAAGSDVDEGATYTYALYHTDGVTSIPSEGELNVQPSED